MLTEKAYYRLSLLLPGAFFVLLMGWLGVDADDLRQPAIYIGCLPLLGPYLLLVPFCFSAMRGKTDQQSREILLTAPVYALFAYWLCTPIYLIQGEFFESFAYAWVSTMLVPIIGYLFVAISLAGCSVLKWIGLVYSSGSRAPIPALAARMNRVRQQGFVLPRMRPVFVQMLLLISLEALVTAGLLLFGR